MRWPLLLLLLVMIGCKREATFQMFMQSADTFSGEEGPNPDPDATDDAAPATSVVFGDTLTAKVPRFGSLPQRVFVEKIKKWVDTDRLIEVPVLTATPHFVHEHATTLYLPGSKTETLSVGQQVSGYKRMVNGLIVLTPEGMLAGIITDTIVTPTPLTPEEAMLCARKYAANSVLFDGWLGAAKRCAGLAGTPEATQFLAGLKAIESNDFSAYKAVDKPDAAATTPVQAESLAYVRKGQVKVRVGGKIVPLAYNQPVFVAAIDGAVAHIQLDLQVLVELDPFGNGEAKLVQPRPLADVLVDSLNGAPVNALLAIDRAKSALAPSGFKGAYPLARERFLLPKPLDTRERTAILGLALAADALEEVLTPLSKPLATGPIAEEDEIESTGAWLLYGCRGSPRTARIHDMEEREPETYEMSSFAKNSCLANVHPQPLVAPENPSGSDHWEEETAAGRRAAMRAFEKEERAFNRRTAERERFHKSLQKAFKSDPFLLVQVPASEVTGEAKVFAFKQQLSTSYDVRGGSWWISPNPKAFVLKEITLPPEAAKASALKLLISLTSQEREDEDVGVLVAESEDAATQWLANRQGSSNELKFKSSGQVWHAFGPLNISHY